MSAVEHVELRRAIIATARDMNRVGLNQGTSGNIGHRVVEGFLVTPTGMEYDRLRPADIVLMRFDGSHEGRRAPSSEWRFHRDILAARPEIDVVLHTHSMFATTLACLGREIPSFHYMVAVAGGASIRCAPYATFGSETLSRHAVEALDGHKACLLANHGMIVLGKTLRETLKRAVEVETLAAMYWRALQRGEPALLGEPEMTRILEKFKSYGQQLPPPLAGEGRGGGIDEAPTDRRATTTAPHPNPPPQAGEGMRRASRARRRP
jgi:L-fuculose-phosphate aldolase